jgi:hypothetical protein
MSRASLKAAGLAALLGGVAVGGLLLGGAVWATKEARKNNEAARENRDSAMGSAIISAIENGASARLVEDLRLRSGTTFGTLLFTAPDGSSFTATVRNPAEPTRRGSSYCYDVGWFDPSNPAGVTGQREVCASRPVLVVDAQGIAR